MGGKQAPWGSAGGAGRAGEGSDPCWTCEGRGVIRLNGGGGQMCGLCRTMLTFSSEEQVIDLSTTSTPQLPCGHSAMHVVVLPRYLPCFACKGDHDAVTEQRCAQLAEEARNDRAQWSTPLYRLPAPTRRELRNRVVSPDDSEGDEGNEGMGEGEE